MEFQRQQSIYLQIADYICEEILRHVWEENSKIPSIRDLAILVEVNPNTVVRTYAYLEEKGIIYKERGLGYFIADDGYNQALRFKKELFLNEHLPGVFKNIDLLNITFKDLQNLYQQHKNKIMGEKHEK